MDTWIVSDGLVWFEPTAKPPMINIVSTDFDFLFELELENNLRCWLDKEKTKLGLSEGDRKAAKLNTNNDGVGGIQ